MGLGKAASVFVSGKGTLAGVNDSTPFLGGQVGKVVEFPGSAGGVNTKELPGVYQYVKRTSGDTSTWAVGSVVYWADVDDFVVSAAPAGSLGGAAQPFPAGVALGTAPAAGNYGFIQVDGIAPVVVPSTVATTGFPLVVDTSVTPSRAKVQAQTAVADLLIPIVGKAVSTVASTVATTIQVYLNLPRIQW